MKEFLTSYIGEFLTAIIAAFCGWFFSRRKQRAEVNSSEIDNGAKAVNLYKETLDDLGNRYEKKYQDIVALYNNREKLLRDEIAMLKSKLKMLKQENISLKKRVSELETQINTK